MEDFPDAANAVALNRDQVRRLHAPITGQEHDYHEISGNRKADKRRHVVLANPDWPGGLGSLIRQLQGKQCWSVIAGQGSGSQVKLDFGQLIPRRRAVRNRVLRPDQRDFEGEFDLFIQCAWRLEERDQVICGSTDNDRNDGPMVRGLSKLTDQMVLAAEVDEPVPDLTIQFSGELLLRVFCDQSNVEDGNDNYSVRVGETILAIGPRGKLLLETRAFD